MKYRPEIDGLRTVAVLPVILFHAGFSPFSGGYVGVDIFFVISGYLITTILIDDLARGRFSILRFYERRARRILPALFTVLAVCVPLAWIWMLPTQYKDFAQSLVAVVLFASNFLFWKESGYFGGTSEEKPLLHTWSLAVEEQYYLLFPLFLFLIWRFGRKSALGGIVLLGLASFAACEWGWRRHAPDANFYLAPFRAWELFIGSACAFTMTSERRPGPNAMLAGLGLGLIAIAVISFDSTTSFPSLYALAPTLGAALIIVFSTSLDPVGKLLCLRPMVGIGLISYSAYLWHQPLFAFARLRHVFPPSPWLMAFLAMLSLILAGLSWRYIEQPFRGKTPFPKTRKALFSMAVVGSVLFVAIGVQGHRSNGMNANAIYAVPFLGDGGPCYFISTPSEARLQACREDLGDRPRIVLIGDSHAQALSLILRRALAARGTALITFASAGCLPVPGVEIREGALRPECPPFIQSAFEVAADLTPQTILLHGRWAYNMQGKGYRNSLGIDEKLAPTRLSVSGDDSPPGLARSNMESHIAQVLNVTSAVAPVVIVGQVPEPGWWPPHIAQLGRNDLLSEDYAAYQARNADETELFRSLASANSRILYFGPDAALCPKATPRRCDQERDGALLYFDSNHLSHAGARIVVDDLMHYLPDWAGLASDPQSQNP